MHFDEFSILQMTETDRRQLLERFYPRVLSFFYSGLLFLEVKGG